MNGLGEVLQTARRAHGLTQDELADAAGITQAALSRYEQGLREPDEAILTSLAAKLGVTVGFLRSAGSVQGAVAVDAHMRRRATAKATHWRQLEAQLNMYRMHVRWMFEQVSIHATQRVPTFDPIDTPPAEAALFVRAQWRMPIGPVQNLVRWVEAAGTVVVMQDFGTPRIDGLSQWVEDHPVMLVNSGSPTDKLRFTVAHELAHLCLHTENVVRDMEADANTFAAEFLMPAHVIQQQLRNLDLGKLCDLKREWGVSMQALVERAHQLKTITAQQRTAYYKAFSARGWRTREPISEELPPERAELPSMVARKMTDNGMSKDEIANIAGWTRAESNTLFRVPDTRLRAI